MHRCYCSLSRRQTIRIHKKQLGNDESKCISLFYNAGTFKVTRVNYVTITIFEQVMQSSLLKGRDLYLNLMVKTLFQAPKLSI